MRDESRSKRSRARQPAGVVSLSIWLFGVWLLLTWAPFTIEQELFGAAFAIGVAAVVAPFGGVARPWLLLDPRRIVALGRLLLETPARILVANLNLARRIWAPSRPLASGMIIVSTQARSPGGVTAVGLISSLVVDNQLVDVDRRRHQLQYHAVAVPAGGAAKRRAAINGPVERMLAPLMREHR